jgi:hypothetical protein
MLGGVLLLLAELAVLAAIVNLTSRFFPRVGRIFKLAVVSVLVFAAIIWVCSGTS